MPKERTGSVWFAKDKDGRIRKDSKGNVLVYARVCFTDARGKRVDIKRRARNESNARRLIREILNEIDARGERSLDARRMTFGQFADWYEERYLHAARYVGGRKVSGVRAPEKSVWTLNRLREGFTRFLVRDITTSDVEDYRAARLGKPIVRVSPPAPVRGRGVVRLRLPVVYMRERAIASVNRELALLRRMLNVALREGWIGRSPFQTGRSLISIADETKRTRTVSREEEARLLAACAGRREHLRAIIMTAVDTGMRHGELLKLRWADVDLSARRIVVRAWNTKTATERRVGMTARVAAALSELRAAREEGDDRVFRIDTNFRKAWDSVRRAANLADVKFHDLRHTAATRMIQAGLPVAEVGRVLGHAHLDTTYRYINADESLPARAAELLERAG